MGHEVREFELGSLPVGLNYPPIFFAEVGSFFNGDVDQARSLFSKIVAARDANPRVPVVLKTEILNDAEICLKGDTAEVYQNKQGTIKRESYRELIERKVMPLERYEQLFSYTREMRIPTVVSVYDFDAADFAAAQGAVGLKIASANLVHIPLIEHVAKIGLPMVIDTGRSSLHEVARAVESARLAGADDILLQHSPDGHPALPEAHNLRILQTYQECFGLPTALSDHYMGVEMLYVAIALGACGVEKGLYFDSTVLDQDISFAMDIGDLPNVMQKTFECWQALGSSWRDKRKSIKSTVGTSQRQCLVAKKSLLPGEELNFDNVRFAFPCKGIPVENWPVVKNWKVRSAVAIDKPIQWQDVAADV